MKRESASCKRLVELTNQIFLEAVQESVDIRDRHIESYNDAQYFMIEVRDNITYAEIYGKEGELEIWQAVKKSIDDKYLAKVLKLDTFYLQDMIQIHELGIIVRTNRTLQAVLTELAERELLQDLDQSDTN